MCVLWNISLFVVFYIWITLCQCQKRIHPGIPVAANKPYMVYLLRSNQSNKQYNTWVCGGCIVSKDKVLTSAACINDVSHVYVIAGYQYYISSEQVDTDPCTQRHKRKVIGFSSPRAYNFTQMSKWMNLDVAVATVDRPFNFTNRSYRLFCSYVPQPITISYNKYYQNIGTAVKTYRWGHQEQIKSGVLKAQNANGLNVATAKISKNTICKKRFGNQTGLDAAIDKWMLCVSGNAQNNEDSDGLFDSEEFDIYSSQENNDDPGKNMNKNITTELKKNGNMTTTIPNNYYGGPLVTWTGDHEVVIGVRINAAGHEQLDCEDPSLFISTYCLGIILECLLTADVDSLRRCSSSTKSLGYEITEKKVTWTVEDGPKIPAETFQESIEDKLQPSASKQNSSRITENHPSPDNVGETQGDETYRRGVNKKEFLRISTNQKILSQPDIIVGGIQLETKGDDDKDGFIQIRFNHDNGQELTSQNDKVLEDRPNSAIELHPKGFIIPISGTVNEDNESGCGQDEYQVENDKHDRSLLDDRQEPSPPKYYDQFDNKQADVTPDETEYIHASPTDNEQMYIPDEEDSIETIRYRSLEPLQA